jgi:hypothetical protein
LWLRREVVVAEEEGGWLKREVVVAEEGGGGG